MLNLARFIIWILCLGITWFQVTGEAERERKGDSRNFRLAPVVKVTSDIPPTTDTARFGVSRLMDGKLPNDGWRSTWTAWFNKDPVLTFDLGEKKRIGVVRVFFQAWEQADELGEIKVEVGLDGENFFEFNIFDGFVVERGKGYWAELDLRAVQARYFRLSPRFQGWGHQWGEVEFWEIL